MEVNSLDAAQLKYLENLLVSQRISRVSRIYILECMRDGVKSQKKHQEASLWEAIERNKNENY